MVRWFCFLLCLFASPAFAADIIVPAGGNVQPTLDTAKPGDTLLLACGAVYAPFVVRRPVTIKGDCALPEGTITAAEGLRRPRIVSTDRSQPIIIANGARNVSLIGLAVTQTGGQTYQLVSIGAVGVATVAEFASDILLDRLYLFVADDMEQRRGVLCNGDGITITRSRIENIKERGADSQAIGCWNLPGRLTITDNWLVAAGEVVIIGGGDPSVPGLTPTGILIQNNDLTRPIAWRTLIQPWQVKNLLELKHARDVKILNNRMWNNWAAAQDGFAWLFTVQNQDGGCWWCTVEGVLAEGNRIWNVGQCLQVSGRDAEGQASAVMERVIVRHNVCETWGPPEVGQAVTITGTPHRMTFDRNTFLNTCNLLQIAGKVGAGSEGMVWTNTLGRHGDKCWGLVSSEGGGTAALNAFWAQGWTFTNNTLANGLAAGSHPVFYPPTTTMPTQAEFERCFVAYQMPYTVKPDGPCKGQGAVLEPAIDKPATPTLLRLIVD